MTKEQIKQALIEEFKKSIQWAKEMEDENTITSQYKYGEAEGIAIALRLLSK